MLYSWLECEDKSKNWLQRDQKRKKRKESQVIVFEDNFKK